MITIPRAPDLPPPYARTAPAYSSVTNSTASSVLSTNSFKNDVYEYGSKSVVLRFSQHKRIGVRVPAYGRAGKVDGEVFLRSTSHVESVTISLRGEIKTTIESSIRPTFSSKTVLLDRLYTAWPAPNQLNTPTPHNVPFSFAFPTAVGEQSSPLPPSFAGTLTEGSVRIKYTVVAHIRRTGWRGDTIIETEVFYLPLPVEPTISSDTEDTRRVPALNESLYDMSIVELPVKRSTDGKPSSSEVKAHLVCPRVVRLSGDCSAQFSIYISSFTQTVERLLQLAPHLSVRLVRTVKLIARGLSTTEETICARGTLLMPKTSGKTEGQTLVVISGVLEPSATTWTSWEVEGTAKVTYGLRVTLPVSFQPDFAYVDYVVSVSGLSGNHESSSSPDFSLTPTPAALLKKPIGYMPMRV